MPGRSPGSDAGCKRPESVLVVVYTGDGRVLVLRRKKPSHFWQSVAGSLEWDESIEDAVARELREETGLNARLGVQATDCNTINRFLIYPMWRHRYAPGVIENVEHVFSLELDAVRDVTLDPQEHSEYRWLPRAEALARVSSHTNIAAIRRWVPER